MGLDMYLHKKSYIRSANIYKPEFRQAVIVTEGGKPSESIKPERITYVIKEVAYWRKANQIHAWFVDNVQNGIDECQESYVSREQLEQLITYCQMVLESPERAQELLPTKSGFFFGSTDYDENYKTDLQDTIKQLTDVLKEPGDGSFYYHSSW